MEDKANISNAEMKVMNQIWAREKMISVPEMVAILNEEGEEWAYTTVATLLRRLQKKGFLMSMKAEFKLLYYPLITKAQYDKSEARGFVENKFNGSLKNFLVAFTGNKTLNKDEIKELKEWLDEFDR